ncbi:MAG: KTSC domain-containing protein [Sulfuritalea sp.]|nr:KTSC domain-containing protein [Sulfuritalea sp.]
MHPKLIAVTSSWVAGYRFFAGGVLVVATKDGRHYRYDGIPQDLADGLAQASSKGSYVNAVVKKGGFACTALDDTQLDELLREAESVPRVEAPRKASRQGISPELLARYPFLAAVV